MRYCAPPRVIASIFVLICCMILRMGQGNSVSAPPISMPGGDLSGPSQTIVWHYLRQAGDSGMYVFRITNHNTTEPHNHLFHEVVLIESGTAEHVSAEGTRRLRPGDVIVIRPQVWHGYLAPRGLGLINCLIDAPLFQRIAPLLQSAQGAFELLRQRPRDPRRTAPTVLHASPAERAMLTERLETIMAEQRTRANGWQAACNAALLDVLVAAVRLAQKQAAGDTKRPLAGGRTQQAVLEVATLLETHFTEEISLQDLAQAVHLSPGHLSRNFSRQMGMGIVQYLHRMRAEEACRLLRYTNEPIASIASRVGYEDIAYFSRCFRAQIGQSPQQYRIVMRRGTGRL